MEPLVFARQGRSPRVAVLLMGIYAVLVAAIVLIEAAWWLMAALAVPTLPALWGLFANPSAGMRLSADQLAWHSGQRHGDLRLNEIDHMRFDTRWDFSVRVTVILKTGKRLRLPDESLPPHRPLEAAFAAQGVRVVRHHFRVF